MKRIAKALSVLWLAAYAGAAGADVTVTEAWVRATVPKQTATGAFMTIRSTADVSLVGASSPAAKIVEVHEMRMKGEVMSMQAVDVLALPAGKAVELKPGGYHVMLMELVKPLSAGDKVPITLTVRGPGSKEAKVQVTAEVRAAGADHGMKH